MITAIIGWLFLVLEMVVASVLWAAAHVYAEGEGFAPQQAQYGYAVVIGILMRPLLLTVGFILAFFVLDIAGWFVGQALQVFLAGMGGTQVGPIGFAAMLAVIISTMFLFIKTVMKLITHLADRAPQWIGGHSGQSLGEAELAQGAVDSAGRGAGKFGMYAGDKMVNVVNGAAGGISAMREGKAQEASAASKAETEERRHKEMMDALNAGNAARQGGDEAPPNAGGGQKK